MNEEQLPEWIQAIPNTDNRSNVSEMYNLLNDLGARVGNIFSDEVATRLHSKFLIFRNLVQNVDTLDKEDKKLYANTKGYFTQARKRYENALRTYESNKETHDALLKGYDVEHQRYLDMGAREPPVALAFSKKWKSVERTHATASSRLAKTALEISHVEKLKSALDKIPAASNGAAAVPQKKAPQKRKRKAPSSKKTVVVAGKTAPTSKKTVVVAGKKKPRPQVVAEVVVAEPVPTLPPVEKEVEEKEEEPVLKKKAPRKKKKKVKSSKKTVVVVGKKKPRPQVVAEVVHAEVVQTPEPIAPEPEPEPVPTLPPMEKEIEEPEEEVYMPEPMDMGSDEEEEGEEEGEEEMDSDDAFSVGEVGGDPSNYEKGDSDEVSFVCILSGSKLAAQVDDWNRMVTHTRPWLTAMDKSGDGVSKLINVARSFNNRLKEVEKRTTTEKGINTPTDVGDILEMDAYISDAFAEDNGLDMEDLPWLEQDEIAAQTRDIRGICDTCKDKNANTQYHHVWSVSDNGEDMFYCAPHYLEEVITPFVDTLESVYQTYDKNGTDAHTERIVNAHDQLVELYERHKYASRISITLARRIISAYWILDTELFQNESESSSDSNHEIMGEYDKEEEEEDIPAIVSRKRPRQPVECDKEDDANAFVMYKRATRSLCEAHIDSRYAEKTDIDMKRLFAITEMMYSDAAPSVILDSLSDWRKAAPSVVTPSAYAVTISAIGNCSAGPHCDTTFPTWDEAKAYVKSRADGKYTMCHIMPIRTRNV